jgi:predicted aspartyl protease
MAEQGSSFTIKYERLSLVLKSDIYVKATESEGTVTTRKYTAIWDTGAMSTVITPKVVTEFGLKAVAFTRIATPSGTMECSQYFVDLILPQKVTIKNVLVTEATPAGCDALIGMDIISIGDFAVTNHNRFTTFSFRVPSLQTIDFVEHSYL